MRLQIQARRASESACKVHTSLRACASCLYAGQRGAVVPISPIGPIRPLGPIRLMRACIQRVSEASVTVDDRVVGQIERGLVVLLGVGHNDTPKEAQRLADKIVGLRIFDDAVGKMNLSLAEVGGAMLVISQFTLFGDCRKGRRPSFIDAAPPEMADQLYQAFAAAVRALGIPVQTGVFRAHMDVALVNDGPVTLMVETT